MQLSQLIPHLDAEISRLERVRGLLSLHLQFLKTHTELDAAQLARARRTALISTVVLPAQAPDMPSHVTHTLQASSPPLATPEQPNLTRLKQRRQYTRSPEPRQDRRRRAVLLDTALRGPVPTGPVAVSAEEARKSQAAKSAQFTRAEEVKRAGEELIPNFNWRSKGSDVRHADALLQRLMNIGERSSEQSG